MDYKTVKEKLDKLDDEVTSLLVQENKQNDITEYYSSRYNDMIDNCKTFSGNFFEMERFIIQNLVEYNKEGTYNITFDCENMTGIGHMKSSIRNLNQYIKKKALNIYINAKFINMKKDLSDQYSTYGERVFEDCQFLVGIDVSDFTAVTNAERMFENCLNLKNVIGAENLSNVTNAISMFSNCRNLTSINTSGFTKVTDAYGMFGFCNLTSIDTSGFTSVTDARNMFYGCDNLKTIFWGDSFRPTKVQDIFNLPESVQRIGKTICAQSSATLEFIDNLRNTMGLHPNDSIANDYPKYNTIRIRQLSGYKELLFGYMGIAKSKLNRGKKIYMLTSASIIRPKSDLNNSYWINGIAGSLETQIFKITGKHLKPYIRIRDGKIVSEKTVFIPSSSEVYGDSISLGTSDPIEYPQWDNFKFSDNLILLSNRNAPVSWWLDDISINGNSLFVDGYGNLNELGIVEPPSYGLPLCFCI